MTILRGCDIKWRIRATFGRCELNFFSSANSLSVTLTAGKMRLALPFLGFENWVVKEAPKNDHFQRWWHKMAHESHFRKLWVKCFFMRKNFKRHSNSWWNGICAGVSGFWEMSGQKRAKKWRFGDFEVPPDWKEGVKSKNCYDRSISRAKLPPCTNFQRKIRQNVPGYTLGFFCTIIKSLWFPNCVR